MTTQPKEKYYIQVYGKDGNPEFKEVDGTPVQIKGARGADLFLHRDENGYWRVSSGITGMSVTRGQDTQKEAIRDASIKGKPQAIMRFIKQLGGATSPRYKQQNHQLGGILQPIKTRSSRKSGSSRSKRQTIATGLRSLR